ncbi:hypothetical protein AJ79_08821 [Helicocarpus griseus UAMH5409]|uniref:Uncharacterized protein n=1 Tax=Helicocarpus griseus UAMH5409 TaxID=1447875 RepID=A0A2B7WPR4_9EURO|nr:hypothetical protein AJ79_08821 [Helicocarpus griseus UAMH5409]
MSSSKEQAPNGLRDTATSTTVPGDQETEMSNAEDEEEPKTPPGSTRAKELPPSPVGFPVYPGKSFILYEDPPSPFDINAIQPAGPTIKIDTAARIAEMEWLLRQPEYDGQHENIRAAITYYRDGNLPAEDHRCVYFQRGVEVGPDASAADGHLWFESLWAVAWHRNATCQLGHFQLQILAVHAPKKGLGEVTDFCI